MCSESVAKKKKKLTSETLFYFFIVDWDVDKILKALTFATREIYNFTDWKELSAKFDTAYSVKSYIYIYINMGNT